MITLSDILNFTPCFDTAQPWSVLQCLRCYYLEKARLAISCESTADDSKEIKVLCFDENNNNELKRPAKQVSKLKLVL